MFSRLAADGSLSLLGQFSGQGRPWLGALRELESWSRSAGHKPMQALLQQALQVILDLSQEEEVQSMGVFRQGFDVKTWIEQPEQAPAETYLTASD